MNYRLKYSVDVFELKLLARIIMSFCDLTDSWPNQFNDLRICVYILLVLG